MSDRQCRAEEYRANARDAAASAEASPLAQVREKHEFAASAWLQLAALEDSVSSARRRRAAQLRLDPANPPATGDDHGQGPEEI